MKLRFEFVQAFPGVCNWYALHNPGGTTIDVPYKVHKYQWFDEFSNRHDMRLIERVKAFFQAYFGWWILEGIHQFGNCVEPSKHYYQTKEEAMDACTQHYLNMLRSKQ